MLGAEGRINGQLVSRKDQRKNADIAAVGLVANINIRRSDKDIVSSHRNRSAKGIK